MGMNVYLSDVPSELTLTPGQFNALSRISQHPPTWTIPNHIKWSRMMFVNTMQQIDIGHDVGLINPNTFAWESLHPWPIVHAPNNANLTFKIHGLNRLEWEQLNGYTDLLGVPTVDDVLDSAMDFYLYVCRQISGKGMRLRLKTNLIPEPQPFFFEAKA